MLKELIKEEEFNSFLQNNQDELVLVKFFTTWCFPCQELQKNIEKLLLEKKDLVVLGVNAERFPRLAQRPEFNVRSVPSLFLFRQGKMIKKISGGISILQLKEFIDD